MLKIADALKLPVDLATQTLLIVGKRGSGKSSTAVRLAEQLAAAKIPFAVLDPVDVWWGLRSSKDGKGEGIPVYVFGGAHADLPLEPGAGSVLADVLVDHRVNAILVTREFSNRDKARFVSAFADQLFRRNREVLHLFCEEAHELAPERPFKGEEEMLGRMIRLQKLGRSSGIGLTSITQRPASLSKNITTQSEILITHRIIGPQDRNAIHEWIRYHHVEGSQQEVLETLPTLKTGEAWVWAPDFPEDAPIGLCRVAIAPPDTYDSRRTPRAGEQRREPKALAPVDLERLRALMASTLERAKAEDPQELRRRIAELEKQLRQRPAPDREALERGVEAATAHLQQELAGKDAALVKLAQQAKALADWAQREAPPSRPGHLGQVPTLPGDYRFTTHFRPVVDVRPSAIKAERKITPDNGRLRPGALRMLNAIAMWYPDGISEGQVAARASVKRSGGSFSSYKSNLATAGLIRIAGNLLYATEAGMAQLGGPPDTPRTTDEVLALWLPKLRPGAQRMLHELIQLRGLPMSHDDLARGADVNIAGGSFSSYLSNLRTAHLVVDVGKRLVAAHREALFL